MPQYIIRSKQYAEMSAGFYSEYLSEKRMYDAYNEVFSSAATDHKLEHFVELMLRTDRMSKHAIAAIVFQAMAVEAYANLLGMHLLGEDCFYSQHERKPLTKKLSAALQTVGGNLPTDLMDRIAHLIEKRNALVHQKPKAFHFGIEDYDPQNPTAIGDAVNAYLKEIDLAEENLADEVKIYSDLQAAVCSLRGMSIELIDEVRQM